MKNLPIRWKITFWSAITTSGALFVFTIGILISLYWDQIEGVDTAMQAEARHLVSTSPSETRYGAWLQHTSSAGPFMACSIDPANEFFNKLPPTLPDGFANRARGILKPRNLYRADGNWRVCTYSIAGRDIYIAYDLYDVSDRISDLIFSCFLALPFASAVAALGAWIMAGRALAPVRAATETAASIKAGALNMRLPAATAADEIGRLTSVLNEMLERLEQSFHQAGRFAADASHELRTPLTIMSGEIDVLLARKKLDAETAVGLVSLQEEIARLNRITEHLMLLARFDAGNEMEIRESLNLSDLVTEACDDAEFLTSAHRLRLETSIAPNIKVIGDPSQLRRVLLNLLDNACKFNIPGGYIRCLLLTNEEQALLTVSNTGEGIRPELRPRIFERFFRADKARVKAGHGLGLSLCREIMRAHTGEIKLKEDTGDGLTAFVVMLPLNRMSGDADEPQAK